MASQYDSIKTPKELLTQVAMHGFSTQIDDRIRAQDIFGRAPIEDLVELANTAGKTSENFYMVLFSIWHWSDATRFYNQHSNPDRAIWKRDEQTIKELKKQVAVLDENVAHKQETITRYSNQLVDANNEIMETEKALKAANERTADLEMENIKLKAKLYDMMVAKEEK